MKVAVVWTRRHECGDYDQSELITQSITDWAELDHGDVEILRRYLTYRNGLEPHIIIRSEVEEIPLLLNDCVRIARTEQEKNEAAERKRKLAMVKRKAARKDRDRARYEALKAKFEPATK